MKDIRQSSDYASYLSQIGWKVEKIDNVYIYVKKFPLIGSFIKVQRPEEVDFDEIEKLAKKYRAFQIVIEPNSKIIKGFKLSKSPYLPTKSLVLDLTKSQQNILKSFRKDVRYALRKTDSLEPKNEDEAEKFQKEWKNAVNWKRYVMSTHELASLKKSFGKNCLFLTTKDESSGAIFLKANETAYYWQAFTNKEGRKKLYQYKIVWEGILWAKKMSAKYFDFEGIYDKRFPNKNWLGFTHFKKSFGGKEKKYPGAFVKWRMPI